MSTKEETKKGASQEELLLKGEEVVLNAEISPGIYWKSAAVFVLALLVAIFIAKELGTILGVAAVLMAIHAVLLKSILLLSLTNKRVLARYGILQVDVVDIRFSKIESVELERMLPGYLLGYSNVVITGTGQRYIVIPYVANGPAIRRAYNEMALGDEEED